ncbi:hypothetical protein ACHQM5_001446 [Ranunculus cassubicifolius]
MACSCSHWWHAPVYIIVTVVMLIAAISASYSSDSSSKQKSQSPIIPNSPPLTMIDEASESLHKSGFNFMATLVQFTPDLVFTKPNSTIFAIHDTAISNLSLPPLFFKDLLRYHISTSKLSSTDLMNQPQGSCIPTLIIGKNLSVSKIDKDESLIEINGVLISHPDIFSHKHYTIHGVGSIFSPIDQDGNFTRIPSCENMIPKSRNRMPWNQIIRLLSSNGYASFSIGLHSVLDRVLRDEINSSSVTIFAPLDFGYIASPSPMLERIVRSHILPERLGYKELKSLPLKAQLKTLDGVNGLEITEDYSVGKMVRINGVKITSPDFLSYKEFIIHGISKPFDMAKPS